MNPRGHLLLLGLNHEQAPLEVRERFALSPDAVESLYAAAGRDPDVLGCIILNTCNRVEIYLYAHSSKPIDSLRREWLRQTATDAELLAPHEIRKEGETVLAHLMEVAGGLRSQVVGETEILGQVKQAYAAAVARESCGSELNFFFQKAFQAAKWVRTHTAVGEGQVSVATVAVDLAGKIFGRLNSASVLVLGAGEIGARTLKALKSRGVETFSVASRTLERAAGIARNYGGTVLPFENLATNLHFYDIVIASTAAAEPVISRDLLARTRRLRPHRPLFLIDLGIPRDIEPAASDLDEVYLYNLDDLAAIARENLTTREEEVSRSTKWVGNRAREVWERFHAVSPPPTHSPSLPLRREGPAGA
ncbi:MAG: glutamyl-tRNA reductase [Puniceicoccaceae bacterium]|nr:MAG: glutamyl-tRNA reductase [Puniceicoccaceae bacterium]